MEKKTEIQVLKETFDKYPVKTPRLEALKMDLSATEFIVSAMQAYAAQETKSLQERIDELEGALKDMVAPFNGIGAGYLGKKVIEKAKSVLNPNNERANRK